MEQLPSSAEAGMSQRPPFFYGWIVALTCCMLLALTFGIRFSFGVFFDALIRTDHAGFGWSHSETALAFSISMIVLAFGSPPIGWLIDRLGSRRVILLGLLMMSSGLAMTGLMTSLAQFYLFYGVWTGIGVGILGLGTYATTVSHWFDKQGRRGLAIGLAFAGTGIGTLIIAPLSERIIALTDWRTAFFVQAALLVGIGVPLTLLLLRDKPASMGLLPDGIRPLAPTPADNPSSTAPTPHAQPARQWTWAQAARTPAFWLMMLSGALSLAALRVVTVHQVSYMVDIGVSRATAAEVFGSSGLTTALAFVFFGRLSDRIGREMAFIVGSGIQIAALGILITLWQDVPLLVLYIYALLWGIGEGSRSGLLTAIAGDTFPGPAMGTIVGTMGGCFGAGAALGSWMGGAVYDWSGSYVLAFELALAATVIASGCMLLALRLRRNSTRAAPVRSR